jgi:hypothetical protein
MMILLLKLATSNNPFTMKYYTIHVLIQLYLANDSLFHTSLRPPTLTVLLINLFASSFFLIIDPNTPASPDT